MKAKIHVICEMPSDDIGNVDRWHKKYELTMEQVVQLATFLEQLEIEGIDYTSTHGGDA